MSLFSCFRRPKKPEFAIYCDMSNKGKYSARLVDPDDPGIRKAQPHSLLMVPIQIRFYHAKDAMLEMQTRLQAIGIHNAHKARVFVETTIGQTSKGLVFEAREGRNPLQKID